MAGFSPAGCRRLCSALAALLAFASSPGAQAYGPEGHLIAGRVAAPLLCGRAAHAVADLTQGQDLGEIGLWVDRIRSDERYTGAAPWHYINVADDEVLADVVHPSEGDVLWAIDRFAARLVDETLGRREREEALRFLVHLIVDLHQPLHVGLAEDRGGNRVSLRFRGEETNLHRFWDTHAIEWTDLSVSDYAQSISADPGAETAVSLDPRVWAAESLALRPRVYAFGEAGAETPRAYLDLAADTTRERLRLAALRLAGMLNVAFC